MAVEPNNSIRSLAEARLNLNGYSPGSFGCEMFNFFFLSSSLVSSDGDLKEENDGHRISYDVSKLVDFPGFNISTPPSVKDVSYRWRFNVGPSRVPST